MAEIVAPGAPPARSTRSWRGRAYTPTDPARACRQEPRLFPLLTLLRSSNHRHCSHPHKSAAQRTAGAPTPKNLAVGSRLKISMHAEKKGQKTP